MAARSKAWVCDRSLAGTAGSNTAGVMDCLSNVSVVCIQVKATTAGGHSSRGGLPSAVRLGVIVKPWQ